MDDIETIVQTSSGSWSKAGRAAVGNDPGRRKKKDPAEANDRRDGFLGMEPSEAASCAADADTLNNNTGQNNEEREQGNGDQITDNQGCDDSNFPQPALPRHRLLPWRSIGILAIVLIAVTIGVMLAVILPKNQSETKASNGAISSVSSSTPTTAAVRPTPTASEERVELFGMKWDLARTTDMDLKNAGLNGTIPVEIGLMTKLTYLDLSFNDYLSGPIPIQLGALTMLRHLDLSNSALNGTIPTQVGLLVRQELGSLHLGYNRLSGTIPTELGGQTSLSRPFFFLDLADNLLTGTIPTDLKASFWFDLGRNKLSGNIPSEFGLIPRALRDLYLDENMLTGTIPSELAKLTALSTFFLQRNDLTGTVPIELCSVVVPVVDCLDVECSCCLDDFGRSCS